MKMKNRLIVALLTMAFALCFAGSLLADLVAYDWGGATVKHENAIVKEVDGELVLIFTNVPGTAEGIFESRFELPDPKIFKARILAVGGGGSGGSQIQKNNGGGGGGAGGYSYYTNVTLNGGVYAVNVGAGGQQTSGAMKGVSGMPSVITNSAGNIVISTIGGGGGGTSVKVETGGGSGGSGGGGAWVNNVPTEGGAGVGGGSLEGQGNKGGKPAEFLKGHEGDENYRNYNNGGGGGGACRDKVGDVFLGEGGRWGDPGQGITNNITGEMVMYARGGKGGKKTTIAQAASGAGYGWGGDGGNGGNGGAGGDGVVVVRLTRWYENIQIQPPSVLNYGLAKDSSSSNTYSDFKCDIAMLSPTTPSPDFISFNWDTNVLDHAGSVIPSSSLGRNIVY